MPRLNNDASGPATSACYITPSDTATFEMEQIPKALYIGGSGNLRVVFLNDTTPITLIGVS